MLILSTNLAKGIYRLFLAASNIQLFKFRALTLKISIFDLFAEGVLFSATFDQILLIESICLRRVAALA